jgi:hypothetical protein
LQTHLLPQPCLHFQHLPRLRQIHTALQGEQVAERELRAVYGPLAGNSRYHRPNTAVAEQTCPPCLSLPARLQTFRGTAVPAVAIRHTSIGKTRLCLQILLHAASPDCIFSDSLVLPEEHGL